jgi:cbb3-type cytochrome oxidase subunit 1
VVTRVGSVRGSGLALAQIQFREEDGMEWFVKAFVRSSLAWFGLGIVAGVAMAVQPSWVVYRPAHAHMNVVGFLTMMVFGVGYQLLPRLFGHPLWSRKLAISHWWLANTGLAGMIAGFVAAPHIGKSGSMVVAAGGTLFAIGALGFVLNMWHTFNMADARARERDQKRSLPTTQQE